MMELVRRCLDYTYLHYFEIFPKRILNKPYKL